MRPSAELFALGATLHFLIRPHLTSRREIEMDKTVKMLQVSCLSLVAQGLRVLTQSNRTSDSDLHTLALLCSMQNSETLIRCTVSVARVFLAVVFWRLVKLFKWQLACSTTSLIAPTYHLAVI